MLKFNLLRLRFTLFMLILWPLDFVEEYVIAIYR